MVGGPFLLPFSCELGIHLFLFSGRGGKGKRQKGCFAERKKAHNVGNDYFSAGCPAAAAPSSLLALR